MEEIMIYFVPRADLTEVDIKCGECGHVIITVDQDAPDHVNLVTLTARTRVHIEDRHPYKAEPA